MCMCLHGRLCMHVFGDEDVWSPGARITQLWAACHGCWGEPSLGLACTPYTGLSLQPLYYHFYILRTFSFFSSTYLKTHSMLEAMCLPHVLWNAGAGFCYLSGMQLFPVPLLSSLSWDLDSAVFCCGGRPAMLVLHVVVHPTKCPSAPSTWHRWWDFTLYGCVSLPLEKSVDWQASWAVANSADGDSGIQASPEALRSFHFI